MHGWLFHEERLRNLLTKYLCFLMISSFSPFLIVCVFGSHSTQLDDSAKLIRLLSGYGVH